MYLIPFIWLWEILFFRNSSIVRRVAHLLVITIISVAIITFTLHSLGNKPGTMNKTKAIYLWETSRLIPPFQYLGNERFKAMGFSPFEDAKGSLKSIASHPAQFMILSAKIYPLRVVAYLETFQFGFFDPVYMLNPASIKNKFASNLEFYFAVFFTAGLIMCFFRRDILASPVFLALTFYIFFFCIVIFHPSPRLKEVSMPLVYLIGSFGAYRIFKFLKGESEK